MEVSLQTLSVFAATIANFGVCPLTGDVVCFWFILTPLSIVSCWCSGNNSCFNGSNRGIVVAIVAAVLLSLLIK